MEDSKHFEFLATKSKELIEKQVDSYRQMNSYAGTIIGVVALFIPFFLNGLGDSYSTIQFLSIIPILIFIWAIFLMLSILRSKPLDQAFSVEKFQELANKPYDEILLYEIGANTCSFRDNKKIVEQKNSTYNNGVRLTTIGILISILLLLTNNFWKPEKEPLKIQIINNQNKMSKDIKSNSGNTQPVVIPVVLPADRESMNEGVAVPTQPVPQSPTTTGK